MFYFIGLVILSMVVGHETKAAFGFGTLGIGFMLYAVVVPVAHTTKSIIERIAKGD